VNCNKRLFLKLLSLAGLGSILPSPKSLKAPVRQYLTSCKRDELVGLRFKWPVMHDTPNPDPGNDWFVCGEEVEDWFWWKGQYLTNYRHNMFYGCPVGKTEPLQLLCFDCVKLSDSDGFDYSRFELTPNTFYRA